MLVLLVGVSVGVQERHFAADDAEASTKRARCRLLAERFGDLTLNLSLAEGKDRALLCVVLGEWLGPCLSPHHSMPFLVVIPHRGAQGGEGAHQQGGEGAGGGR
jgi:hypothetical protein